MSSAREALFALSHIHCQLCLICGKTGNTAVDILYNEQLR
ncbi:hypothetical protein T03_16836 [Trichinella britovi]|uniref:Uncharacterized protein n=1 Tax=Trichinella britovi TaxID=45882 RepID=A0A0V1BL72_TRIBR|nr:hypothetical protein T03_16836 [Trichinella britovi]